MKCGVHEMSLPCPVARCPSNGMSGLDLLRTEVTELRARVAEWEQKARAWLLSPAAAKQLAGYRELAERCESAEDDASTTRTQLTRVAAVLAAVVGCDPEQARDLPEKALLAHRLASRPTHLSVQLFVPLCGQPQAGQKTTDNLERSDCPACLRTALLRVGATRHQLLGGP